MGLDLHTVSVVTGSGVPAQADRLVVAMFKDVTFQGGNGGIASVAVNTAGVYPGTTIPTVTIATSSTGSSAGATAVMKAVGAVVAAGGSGYAVNDTITLTGGTGTKAVITVTAVSGGVVTAGTITTLGAYTVLPSSPVAQGSTSGSGTGATFTMTWGIASITVGTAGTQYPADGTSVTATVSGGSPTTAAVLANPVVSTIAGEPGVLTFSGLSLPDHYSVLCNPQQDATWYASSKTNSGFTLTLNPRLAGNSLASGAVDVFVVA